MSLRDTVGKLLHIKTKRVEYIVKVYDSNKHMNVCYSHIVAIINGNAKVGSRWVVHENQVLNY
jgi:hypothetical protein